MRICLPRKFGRMQVVKTDDETLLPVTTESLKYGKRVRVIGLPAHPKWRTEKGIETAGPRYFGYDYDYVPIEELVSKAVAAHV